MTTEDDAAEITAPEVVAPGVFLSWSGREQATTLVPAPRVLERIEEHSDPTEFDPGNLVIEGDNRQAMVSLYAQYAGQVDVVLIDPPYNRGRNDFRYSDKRFADPDADTANGSYVAAQDGGKHTKWLNQLAPTLKLLQDLMAPHGVIFVHINDIELPRLLILMEEMFLESNWLGTIVWKSATDNNPSRIVVEHEYIVCWAKNEPSVPRVWRGRAAESRDMMLAEFEKLKAEASNLKELQAMWRRFVSRHKEEIGEFSHYNRVDEDSAYTGMRALHNPGRDGYDYDVVHPNGLACVRPLRGWRFPEERFAELLADGRILFGEDESQIPQLKVYLKDADVSLKGVIHLDSRSATKEIARLFPEQPNVFKYPKPVAIEEYLLAFVAGKDALILDCFAGSGTTGHAVYRLNQRDGGRRRFILIEEGTEGDQYAATLTAERLRRARVQEDLPGGFTFHRVGKQIDREAFATFQRAHIAEAVRQADLSGKGAGIKPVEGTWVIGRNRRNEAICLCYKGPGESVVTIDDLTEMFVEAKKLGLAKPLRVYGTACEVVEDDTFTFFQLPDELLSNLSLGSRQA